MLGNECVLSSGIERLTQSGEIGNIHSSPLCRKAQAILISPDSASGSSPGQVSCSTPKSTAVCHSGEDCGTPDVKAQCKSKYYACPSSGSIKYIHRTPPSRTKNIVVSNPFEVGITDRLHLPMYSPSVFARVVSPSQENPTFRWTIEDISRIYPADIEEFPAHQFEGDMDPELESKAQEAINRFFCKNQPLLPSPWNSKPEAMSIRQEMNAVTPSSTHSIMSSATPGLSVNQHTDSDSDLDQSASSCQLSSREVWTQTTLTLPPILPPSMELALKPFFTFNQDQRQAQQSSDTEDGMLSTSSLRRKLFFQADSASSPTSSTPPQTHAQSHGSRSLTQPVVHFQGRSFGTPLPGSTTLRSPADISPVHNCTTPMRRVKSATRLDFTREQEDMAIDTSMSTGPNTPRQGPVSSQGPACSPLGTAPLHDRDIPEDPADNPQPGVKWVKRNKRNSLDCSSDSMRVSRSSTPVKTHTSMDLSSAPNMMDISHSKPPNHTDGWRDGDQLSDVAYQHDVTNFSYSHQVAPSTILSQDTGYGTRSSCDPTVFHSGTTSMFGLSLTRDKMGYEDSLATWPVNPHLISSTPTKSSRLSEYQHDSA